MNAIEIRGLTKRFDGFTLDNITLTLPQGCILGLIGENGAGKSTTIKLILDMIRRDSGSIRVLGSDNRANAALLRQEIGVVLDDVGIPESLTLQQVAAVMRNSYARWDDAEFSRLAARLALPSDRPFRQFSRGMRMKLGIAVALSHHARLLLLDEATAGLDPVVRDEVVEMLCDFTRQEDHSVLVSSHIVSDLEKLCDYIAFLHKGRLMLCEEKDQLLATYGLVPCSAETLAALPDGAVQHKKESPYGVEALVLRDAVPADIPVRPISIEELFLFMVKEEK